MSKKPLIKIALLSSVLVIISIIWVVFLEKNTVVATPSNASSTQAQKKQVSNSVLAVSDPTISQGFDWSLPTNTTVNKNAGFIEEYSSDSAYIHNIFIRARWDTLNPKKDQFDFSTIDQQLDNAKYKKALVRLEVNSACETPKWALKELRFTNKKSLVFWDENYLTLLAPLIKKFADRYANRHQIVGLQLGIGDGEYTGSCNDFSTKDGWGEFWMTPEELVEAEDTFGLTPQLFEKRSKQIIDIYADAFKGNEGKLAFTNAEPYFSWTKRADPYNKIMIELSDYVHTRGLGNRDGAVEVWMRYLTPTFGMKFETINKHEDTCRLTMDEAFAKRIRGRYWGTENEFYGDEAYVLDAMGPYKNQAYRFYVSSLRSLQMRRNFSLIYGEMMQKLDDPIYKTQDFLNYLNKTMGKKIEDTPDVFVLLGERYIEKSRTNDHPQTACLNAYADRVAVGSFGRWLKENGESHPAMKIKMPKNEKKWGQGLYLPDGVDYEYAARSSKRFEFDLDDELARVRCHRRRNNKGCTADLKITYKDNVKTTFLVRVEEGQTKAINTQGDGKIKTVTFSIQSKFRNKLQGSDFVVESVNKEIPVLLIRMNFLD